MDAKPLDIPPLKCPSLSPFHHRTAFPDKRQDTRSGFYQDNLVGVDFCEQMVKQTNPGVLEKAEKKECPHADVHGFRTVADIMRALNPFTGSFYREALQ